MAVISGTSVTLSTLKSLAPDSWAGIDLVRIHSRHSPKSPGR